MSLAAMACFKTGRQSRLIYAIRDCRGRKDEPKRFGWRDLHDLAVRARVTSDCCLKTRGRPETRASLENLVAPARTVRDEPAATGSDRPVPQPRPIVLRHRAGGDAAARATAVGVGDTIAVRRGA